MDAGLIGLDPGLDGGVAFYRPFHSEAALQLEVGVMPTLGSGGSKREIDVATLHDHVVAFRYSLPVDAPLLAVLEQVSARPGQGVTSMFTFGTAYGEVRGLLKALRVPYELVQPSRWKKLVLAGTTRDKEAAIAFCRRRFPAVSLKRTPACRTAHHGMAEAICLALYGQSLLVR